MGSVIIPEGYFEMILTWGSMSALGSVPQSVFGFADEGMSSDFAAYGAALPDATQELLNPIDSSWQVTSIRTRLGDAAPPYSFFDVPTPGVTGTVTGNSQTPNTACLVRKTTLAQGKGATGRFYLPGVPEGAVDDNGVIDSSFLTDVTDAILAWQLALAAVGVGAMYVLHGEGTPLEATPSAVLACVPLANAASQRRRLRR